MILLHATFCDRRLFVWGEAPASEPAAYPYDAGKDRLAEAIAGIFATQRDLRRLARKAIAWLPAAAGRPLASSPLIAENPASSGEPALAPFAVTAAALDADQAIQLLSACRDKPVLQPGVIIGHDLAYCAAVLRFASALLARQQFLPGIEEQEGRFFARWRPVIQGADAERLAALAKAMPEPARALTSDREKPPETSRAGLLSGFIEWIVDFAPRTAARSTRKRPQFDSLHDQWLWALNTPDGEMEGDGRQLAAFAAQVREWQRPISVSAESPFRLCFRLEEPQNGADPWQVRFLVQPVKDLSLLVTAGEVWAGRGRAAAALKQHGGNPREPLLASLGQAAIICPRIERSLKARAPDGYKLDATGAHEFLTRTASLLEQSGFGVLLPAWWTRKGTKLRLSARASVRSPKLQAGGLLSLNSVVEFDWQVALGGEVLSKQELEALAELKAPLVKVRGQCVELRSEEIQAALDFWKKRGAATATARDVVQMALGQARLPGGLEFEGVSATGWIASLIEQLEGRTVLEELTSPEGFQGTLRPYQVRGYSWLAFLRRWGLGACLADDMGLGKTIQALALIERDFPAGGKRPVLLICPTSVVTNWQKEASRFTPELPVLIHHGIARRKGPAFVKEAEEHALVVSSYALLQRDLEILKQVNWAGVILDEAQNIKNPETKQAQAARALTAEYRMALTGTPVENNVGELWSIMEFLNPGLLGSQAEFKRSFFIPIQARRDPAAIERLKRLTGPFILRRLKSDKSIIADLPEKMEMKVFCPLTREQASLYAAVVKEFEESLESAEGIQRKGMILATLSKLKQVCNHPAQFLKDNSAVPGRSGKLARLTEMLEEIQEVGERSLVFTQFAEMGEILKRHLEENFGREVLFLHGAVPKQRRDRMVERFQRDGGGPSVFILSLKAGGTGLNLTGASHVFHFDRWWNPAVENQATDRAYRIGQTRNVEVHKFVCAGTLEEKIDEMIERKKDIAERVVGAGEAWITELSTTELRDIFALRKEAVGD